MGILDDLKKWAHPYEDEDEEYEDDFPDLRDRGDTGAFADRRSLDRKAEDRRNKVVNINATTQLKVVLVKPERFENASEIADHLKEKRTVVINLESTNKDIARRLIDFLSGVAYAGEGKIKKVAANTYIITPYHVDIMGDLIDELENNGLYLQRNGGWDTMLTPQEVSGRAFSKAAFGGYNMAMVDEFLDELTDDHTSLYKENAALKAKLKVLVDKVEEYRATEDSMRAALLTAQRMASTMVEEAEEKKKTMLAGAEDEARAKIGALQSDVELEQRRLNAAKAATADFLQKTRELAQAQLALIERAPDLTPEEIAGGEKAEQKAEADVNAIEEKILASFHPAAEEPAPEKAQETAPAEEQSAPKAEEPKAEPLEPDDSPFVETASHAIRLDDLKFGRNYHGEE